MKYGVYVIRDVETGYLTPTIDVNDNSAKRNFAFAMNRPDSIMHFRPKDYSLHRIAEYDSETGVLYDEIGIVKLCEGVDVVES